VELALQPRSFGGNIGMIDCRPRRSLLRILPVFVGLAALLLTVDNAIVRFAQPLAETLNQLASGPRRASDLIEKFARREDFCLDLVGGSRGRIAGTVFHNAHLADKLPRANRAEKDGVIIDFPDYVNGTAKEANNTVRWISLSEKDLSSGEMRARHLQPLLRM
jgi:hypothetical protein